MAVSDSLPQINLGVQGGTQGGPHKGSAEASSLSIDEASETHSIAIDESTDVQDKAELAVFIRGCDAFFKFMIQKLVSLYEAPAVTGVVEGKNAQNKASDHSLPQVNLSVQGGTQGVPTADFYRTTTSNEKHAYQNFKSVGLIDDE
ncbi:hypothetical protein TNCV_1344441 [Trichonephila clavipes]|nr:hypothetical protein TNCV_1344441 [Trichonephila clavipes]